MRRCATCGHAVVVQFVVVSFGSIRARALCQPESSWSSAQKQFFFPDATRSNFRQRNAERNRKPDCRVGLPCVSSNGEFQAIRYINRRPSRLSWRTSHLRFTP